MRSKTSVLGVKSFKQDIKSGIVIFLTIATLGTITVFAANWYDSYIFTTGEVLSATKLNAIVKATVPTGFIGAFNLTVCPDTWTEYTPARGRFLRGIDSTGVNDAVRVLGDLQTDAFQGHWHDVSNNDGYMPRTQITGSDGGYGSYGQLYQDVNTYKAKTIITDGVNGVPKISTETRPKNVAVLYCVKQ